MDRAAVWQHSSKSNIKLSTTLLSLSCVIHLISLLMMSSLVCDKRGIQVRYWGIPPEVFKCSVREMRRHLISRTEHLNTLGITSHGTDSFHVKPITPGYPIPKITANLTIFWGGTWKTEFVKRIYRQERTSSENLYKKCSIEACTILMFELLLCCHTAASCMERT